MLRLLIVENDDFIDSSFADSINWSACSFTVSLVCKDISEAAKRLEEFDVMLIFPDENFDFSNIKIFSEKKIIAVGKNGDFKSLYNCTKNGITKFIKYPVTARKLFPVLNEIKEETENEKAFKSIVVYAVAGGLPPETLLKSGIDLNGISKKLCFIEIVPYICSDENYAFEASNIIIYNTVRNYAKNSDYILNVYKTSHTTRFVADVLKLNENGFKTEHLNKRLSALLEDENIKISITSGKCVDSVFKLSESKKSVAFLNNIRFYKNEESITDFEKEQKNTFSYIYDKSVVSDTAETVVSGSEPEILEAAESFMKSMYENRVYVSSVKIAIHDVAVRIINSSASLGADISNVYFNDEWIDSIETSNINYVKTKLCEFLKNMSAQIKAHIKNDGESVVNSIIDYAAKNYGDDIDLKYFAQKYFINVSYLGQLFKKITGTSFNKFLNEIRLNEAKKLLSTKKIKIFEVAARVGFKDSNYFCSKFEKHVGLTPTNYRNKFSQNEEE